MDLTGYTSVSFPVIPFQVGDEFRLLLISDLHLGSSSINEKNLVQDLEWAMANNARILINGDVFDAIVSSDPRWMASQVKKDITSRDDLLDAYAEFAVNFLKPYAANIDLIGIGNHEIIILKHHFQSLIKERLIPKLNNPDIRYGGYGGFCSYAFRNADIGLGGTQYRITIFRHHGIGGSAPVTHGKIDLSRFKEWVEGANIIWLGHKHYRLHDVVLGVRQTMKDTIEARDVHCIITGSYLNMIDGSYGLYRGYAPQSHGGAYVEVILKKKKPLIRISM